MRGLGFLECSTSCWLSIETALSYLNLTNLIGSDRLEEDVTDPTLPAVAIRPLNTPVLIRTVRPAEAGRKALGKRHRGLTAVFTTPIIESTIGWAVVFVGAGAEGEAVPQTARVACPPRGGG